jgi:hypothetical protein
MPGASVAVDSVPIADAPVATAARSGKGHNVHVQARASALFNTHGCPYGEFTFWTCFYDLPNFGGQKLEFQDTGYTQYFSDYGFDDRTSSWVNTKHNDHVVNVRDDFGTLLWSEPVTSESSYVGGANDNRASYFKIY